MIERDLSEEEIQLQRAAPPSRWSPSSRARPALRVTSRVLLAEDDPEWRHLVARALRGDGYHVTEVPDGGRLLVHLGKTYLVGSPYDAFDVVVSDIRMPVMNGLQILERLREARWPTPVILMTAFGSRSVHERAEALGAIVFDKPLDLDDLRTAVSNVVDQGSVAPRRRRAGDLATRRPPPR